VEAAYKALLDSKDEVNAEASATGAAAPAPRAPDAIGTAANALSEAAYPLLKGMDWNADFISGAKPAAILQAVKKVWIRRLLGPKFVKEGALAQASSTSNITPRACCPSLVSQRSTWRSAT